MDSSSASAIDPTLDPAFSGMSFAEVCALALQQQAQIKHINAVNAKMAHEMAVLKRLKFAATSERFNAEQKSLLEEAIDEDLEALEREVGQLSQPVKPVGEKQIPKRLPLPAHLPRHDIHHEPANTACTTPGCGCTMTRIGEDVAEKLDYEPGRFSVERHVRGKWACARCQTLTQAPVPACVIDKGLATAGLMAHVVVAKYIDHQPLYRQEAILGRAGFAVPRSTQAEWIGAIGVALAPLVQAMREDLLGRRVLHADETPVAMLKPANLRDGKTHRAYLWSYCTTTWDDLNAVVFDFAESRAGHNARRFLGIDGDGSGGWRGTLICDDYAGYKQVMNAGVTEAGCLAHARRKFHELWVNHQSTLADGALKLFGALYDIEREVKDLGRDERLRKRQARSRPAADLLHDWLIANRQKVPDGGATAKAIDYSLKRWAALTRFIDDADLAADNNRIENLIRPIALGRKNWLFAGSLRAGQRAAAIMSLLHTARLNGHEPYAYLKNVLERLPTQPASALRALLPYRWVPGT
ncbi:IS66 family transposase [Leptothrix discophora]|uniref:IS66 family transposase n=1 Tax=Leptothrix discophora TaxID=89 RepID=UPI00387ECA70